MLHVCKNDSIKYAKVSLHVLKLCICNLEKITNYVVFIGQKYLNAKKLERGTSKGTNFKTPVFIVAMNNIVFIYIVSGCILYIIRIFCESLYTFH